MNVAIGIPVFEDESFLEYALKSVQWYTHGVPYTIYVHDDGSQSPSALAYEQEWSRAVGAKFSRSESNMGVAASWNRLCENAFDDGADTMVLLNSDIVVPPNWLICAMHFLENNPVGVGSVYWEAKNLPRVDAMNLVEHIHNKLWHTEFDFSDPITGKRSLVEMVPNAKQPGAHVARVMSPAGCCFAFTREVWDIVGEFDESFGSFHEESDFGMRCAAAGMASFGLPYPQPYHVWSGTFSKFPEMAQRAMEKSRAALCDKWKVPEKVRKEGGHAYLSYIHNKLMDSSKSIVPKSLELSYVLPDFTQEEPVADYTGTIHKLPMLVEHTGVF